MCVGGQREERVVLFIVHRNRGCSSSQMKRITFMHERKNGRKWVGKDNCRICTVQKRITKDAISSMEKMFHPWSWMK